MINCTGLQKVNILKQYKGGDGRFRKDIGSAAIAVGRIVYVEHIGAWQGKPITCVHFDDGTVLDVLMNISEIMELTSTGGGK